MQDLVQAGEKVIVFRNQRGATQGCAAYLARDLGLPPAADALAALPTHDLSTTSAILRECLRGGTAFHNTNLSREERMVVERAFRDPNGAVRVLAATTTVAAGINTPASTVILAETEFLGETGRPFTVAEYKNMAGRAGRLGFNEEGKAIIVAETVYQREMLVQRYVRGQLESLHSTMDPENPEPWVIRLLAQVGEIREEDVFRLIAGTYGGHLATRDDPKWQTRTETYLAHLLSRMAGLGLIERQGDCVQLTLLGRACGASPLSLASALRLVDLLRGTQAATMTAERLIALLQVLREADEGYTPLYKQGRGEAARPRETAARYGPEATAALQRFAGDEWVYYARCKRASVLWDWIAGVPMETIEQRYTANLYQGRLGSGDIRRFADTTRFHLRSAHQIASIIFVGQGPDEEAIETLLRQLEVGIPAAIVPLLALPVPLTRGELLALHAAGVATVDGVWTLSPDDLSAIIGDDRSMQLLDSRPSGDEPADGRSTNSDI